MTPRRDAPLWCPLAYAAASFFHDRSAEAFALREEIRAQIRILFVDTSQARCLFFDQFMPLLSGFISQGDNRM